MHLQSNICPHASYPVLGRIASGRVVDNCLVCPFHGGRFSQEGTFLHPKEDLVIHKNLSKYTVSTSQGDVWTAFSQEQNAQQSPHFEYGGLFYRYSKIVAAPWYRLIQVGMDFMHVQYVHAGSFGRGIQEVSVDYSSFSQEENHAKVFADVKHSVHGTMRMSAEFYFPGVVIVENSLQVTMMLVRPINNESSFAEIRVYPKFTGPYSGVMYILCQAGIFERRLPYVVLEDELFVTQISSGTDIFHESLFPEDVLWKHFRTLLKGALNV